MMPSVDEQLSRYLEGDLPPDEAAALEARIEASPEVAGALEDLRALRDALHQLPTELPPPPLRSTSVASRPWRRALPRVLPWALAAAAIVLWLARPPAPPSVVLTAGVSELSGQARILAGDVTIDLDGRARIAVEPAGGALRPADQKEDSMDVRTPLAALAGAAVTLVVIEGSAVVTEPDASTTVRVEPGRAQTFGKVRNLPAAPDERAAALQAEIAALQEQLTATEEELATSTFSRELAQGQLQMLQGTESVWPDDVPDTMTPERFEGELRKQVEAIEGVEVDRVDCDEFPCVAVLRIGEGADDFTWEDASADGLRDWFAAEFGGRFSLSVNSSRFSHDDYEASYVLFAVRGETEGEDPGDVGVRTKYRMDTLVENLGQETAAEAEEQEISP